MKIHAIGSLSELEKTEKTGLCTLLYMEKGRGRVRLGDAVYEVGTGEAFLVLPAFSIEKVGDWQGAEGKFISFSGGETLSTENCTLYPDETAKHLLRENTKESADALFLHLKKESNEKAFSPTLRAYMRENLYTHLSLKATAADLGVTVPALEKACREAFGRSFGAYVVKERLEHAKHLLANRMLSISDIAQRMGYSSSQYFSTAFKKETGLSPSDYRKYVIKQ